jgi:methylated-DNA-[protein]-cysteine S-methyltransferase
VFDVVVAFPWMKVAVKTRDERVAEIRYLHSSVSVVEPKNPLAARAAQQLERYLADPDAGFDLPLLIAKRLDAEPRAVGQACGDNRLPIVIPCHRVVAADGIGGFAHSTGGYLVEAKRWLLAHERAADLFELEP